MKIFSTHLLVTVMMQFTLTLQKEWEDLVECINYQPPVIYDYEILWSIQKALEIVLEDFG